MTERDVAVGRSVRVEHVGIVEDRWVAVGRGLGNDHQLSAADGYTANLDVLERNPWPARMVGRGYPQDLLDGLVQPCVDVGHQPIPPARLAQQVEHTEIHSGHHGFMARGEQPRCLPLALSAQPHPKSRRRALGRDGHKNRIAPCRRKPRVPLYRPSPPMLADRSASKPWSAAPRCEAHGTAAQCPARWTASTAAEPQDRSVPVISLLGSM